MHLEGFPVISCKFVWYPKWCSTIVCSSFIACSLYFVCLYNNLFYPTCIRARCEGPKGPYRCIATQCYAAFTVCFPCKLPNRPHAELHHGIVSLSMPRYTSRCFDRSQTLEHLRKGKRPVKITWRMNWLPYITMVETMAQTITIPEKSGILLTQKYSE